MKFQILFLLCLVFLGSSSCKPKIAPAFEEQSNDSLLLSDKNELGQIEQLLADSTRRLSLRFPKGIIPDKETAVALAEPILFAIYGQKQILAERPYTLIKTFHYWSISGHMKAGSDGGTFRIILDERDGRVIDISHEK